MSQLVQMLDTMQERSCQGAASLPFALAELAAQLRRGDVVIVLSDLWDDLDTLFQAVSRINHLGAELILFHVLHQDELELPAWRDVILLESETSARLHVDIDDVRDDYSRRLQRHLAKVRARCRQLDVQYQLAAMSEPFQQTLERYLVRRCTP